MRRRILLSWLTISLVTVVLTCGLLGLVARSLVEQDFDHRLERDVQTAAAALSEMSLQGRTITRSDLAPLVPANRRITYLPSQGSPVSVGHVTGAVRTRQVRVGSVDVRMQAPLSLLHDRITNVWLLILAVGVGTAAIGVPLSVWLAGRATRPLRDLADRAERLGHGDLRPSPVRYRTSELDRLAEVLDRSAEKLATMLGEERRFARDVTHQLRTPLTSLSVRLDEMRTHSSDPHTRDEAAAGLQQVERLMDVVDGVLRDKTPRAGTDEIDVHDLLEAQRREWQPAFGRATRQIVIACADDRARASRGAIEQALATLIDNSLVHGSGTTTVTGRAVGQYVRIDVADEGPGIPEEFGLRVFDDTFSGTGRTGLGLPLARALVEGEGGRLELTGYRPPTFTIFLKAS